MLILALSAGWPSIADLRKLSIVYWRRITNVASALHSYGPSDF